MVRWLAAFPHRRRLTAEEIRDSMLAVSGELNRRVGGPGFRAEINWEVAFQPRLAMGKLVVRLAAGCETFRAEPAFALRDADQESRAIPVMEVLNRPLDRIVAANGETKPRWSRRPFPCFTVSFQQCPGAGARRTARCERMHRTDSDETDRAGFRSHAFGRPPEPRRSWKGFTSGPRENDFASRITPAGKE